jgi:DNA-binding MarR family transcriptional regulator
MPTEDSTRSHQLSEQLRTALKLLVREMRRDIDHHASGLSLMQTVLLASVAEQPGIGVAELARQQQVRSPTMSAQVKALEGAGLLERGAPDPDDRRRSGLQLTDAGRDCLRLHHTRHMDWLTARIARLTPAQMDALEAAIEPLTLIAKT